MAAHMALRGLEPGCGRCRPRSKLYYARERDDCRRASRLCCEQLHDPRARGRTITPLTVRVTDGRADRSATWPESQKFHAEIVAMFRCR